MPFRNERGGWRTKRAYGTVAGIDVPKFNRAIGTESEAEAVKVEAALDAMVTLGKHGALVLSQVASGHMTPLEAFRRYERQEVKDVRALLGEDALETAWTRFLKTAKRKNGSMITARTKKTYAVYLNALLRLNPDATIADLPKLLHDYRDYCIHPARKHHQTFNKTRAACLAFARNTEADKQWSDLWRECAKVDMCTTATMKQNTALLVWEVREIINKLPQERMRNVVWMLALTGMRINEYVTPFEILEDRIAIHGTKSPAAEREVPRVFDPILEPFTYEFGDGRNWVRPKEKPLAYKTLLKAIKEASGNRLTPHDLRHCYRLWLDEAGVSDLRANFYMGQEGKGLKERYARHQADKRLEDDTNRLTAYIESQWEKPKDEEKVPVRRLKLA